jgi:SAM-dependent methyltransferase
MKLLGGGILPIRVLQSATEVQNITSSLRNANCGIHKNQNKNWDLFQVKNCLKDLPFEAKILEVGCGNSWLSTLRFIRKQGYKNLTGIDLTISLRDKLFNIYYAVKETHKPFDIRQANAINLDFVNKTFDLIICLSVIEHGVPLRDFIIEMHRILKKKWKLLISTDYWETKEQKHKTTIGLPWTIFDKQEICNFLRLATKTGFKPIATEIPECKEKVIHWDNEDFTFLSIVLTKN